MDLNYNFDTHRMPKEKIDSVMKDVLKLKNWHSKQPHLPQDVDDYFFISQAVTCKSLEIAKKKIDCYFTVKGKCPQIFGNRDPLDVAMKKAQKSIKFYILPMTNPDDTVIMWLQFVDLNSFDHVSILKMFTLVADLTCLLYPTHLEGMLVIDWRNFSSAWMGKLRPNYLQAVMYWFQKSFQIRSKRGYNIHSPALVDFIVNTLVKPFTKRKLHDRITVSKKGAEVLTDTIPLERLPSDYGGKQKSSDQLYEDLIQLLESKRDWFLKMDKKISNESKRPKSSESYKLDFGLDGTFKTLNID